ncbi:MAG TPA: UDP-2,3-diacylglucosamine diphosphatase [Burkholderiales bacterium]|nr:UDP-2,3-diacylglucosamine diphosphatase [Burkholderiales bacterium]
MPSLFVSDLHLTEERPEANERFISFIEGKAPDAEALYILGDFFEYWVGDDDLGDPFNAVIGGLLANLTRSGVRLYFMHGNRDFLVGDRFCAATGARLLADPSVHEIQGVKTLLVHGDTLCTDDLEYQAWRRHARDPAFQAEFLARPLAERRQAVLEMREKSRLVVQGKTADIMDVNDDAVREAMRSHDVRRVIHGHTHRPGRHALDVNGERCERWVLPDWYGRGGYIEVDRRGPRLVSF